jgi:hypothetical protein
MRLTSWTLWIVLKLWIWVGFSWAEDRILSKPERDDFEQLLDKNFRHICDRWLILSTWSGRYTKHCLKRASLER